MRKFFNEFKTFAVRGNMVDMAVGMIVGGAFTALINSIVSNLATPLIGVLIGVDFSLWQVVLPRFYGNAEPSVLNIGLFLNSIISFVIIAFVVFLFVKALNAFRYKQEKQEPEPEPPMSNEEILLTEIRDVLRKISGEEVLPDAESHCEESSVINSDEESDNVEPDGEKSDDATPGNEII